MRRDFRRVAIVNRGEAAMRFLHGAREFELEHGVGLTTIALFTEPDRHALFVREADEAYDLGPAMAVDPKDGQTKSRYLDYAVLEKALTETRAEAVWVGWGLVAEHAAFVELCDRMGVVFIGPSADTMRQLGDKITSKKLAEEAEVPISPWSGGAVDDMDAARDHAHRLGYPLMIKATAGGGGRGIRKVMTPAELEGAFESARSEALKAFGDATVFLESMVTGAHHVEVQVIADHHGNVWPLGVRDCSVQRRHQKLLEETPSPVLTAGEDAELRAAAARMTAAAGYQNAGTVEFLFDPDVRRFHFLEVNTRLQVEHPVTEMVTGTDLVKLQIHVARGGELEGDPPPARGHAIEARLNAEDPDRGFAPSPGRVEIFRPAKGPGLRVDTGIDEGDEIASEFDSMVAKVIAHGETRAEALARLARGLAQTAVVIRGGSTNKAFLQELLNQPEVIAGKADVQWLDRLSARGERLPARHADVALQMAAVEAFEADEDLDRARFWATAARGRPEAAGDECGRKIELRHRGETYSFLVFRTSERRYRLSLDEHALELEVDRLGRYERRVHAGGNSHRVITVTQGIDIVVEVDGVPHRITRDEQGVVRAPAPAVVVSIAVEEGDEVEVGERLAVVEAMKMETEIRAEFAGRVKSVEVRKNVQVAAGAPLLVIEPSGEADTGGGGDRVRFSSAAAGDGDEGDPRQSCLDNLDDLIQLYLGWDAEASEPAQMIARHGIVCSGLDPDDPEVEEREESLLEVFVDIASLFRRRPADDEDAAGADRRTSEEYLFSYLRDPGAEGKDLPAPFLASLRRALAHYGVDDLEPSDELNEALFRLYKTHRRMAGQLAPVLGILDRRLEHGEALVGSTGDRFHELLHRLIEETRDRYPAVHDLAREVHYRYLDEPFLERIRRQGYAEVDEHLERLLEEPGEKERRRLVAAVVANPQPLAGRFVRHLAEHGDAVSDAERRLRLGILLRRLYRVRDIDDVDTLDYKGRAFATSDYREDTLGLEEEGRTFVALTEAPWEELDETLSAAARVVKKGTGLRRRGVLDVLLHLSGEAPADELAARAAAAVETAGFSRRAIRVVTSVWSDDRVHHFTFRAQKKGWEEDRLVRDIHPMLAERLELWRLKNFQVERMPSADDIYAFHGTARDNPRDERLFVIAEVRDMTPMADGEGPMRFPHLERMFHESLAVIRRFQAQRSPETRLHWNRVTLYLWPILEMPGERLRALIRRLAPQVEGLGLQKVVVSGRMPDAGSGDPEPTVIELSHPTNRGVMMRLRESGDQPIESMSEYQSKVVRLRRRGLVYPYELIRMLAPPEGVESGLPAGEFVEYDLEDDAASPPLAVPVDREPGGNRANLVIGVVRNFTDAYPEGMSRVLIASDPTRGMGSLAEAECRRILAALDLAARMHVPVEWFAISAGAKISMQSGTENMDWIALVLRRLVEFTQDGGGVNIVVPGINVGAQPYWNAEATMLMHTRGVLIMTPQGAMVLTGKDALDYSGGVSAEDNQGIGGYERIMGPNGQAQYLARDLADACGILLAYYERSYAAPGERFPRRRDTGDPARRDVRDTAHGDAGFERVGEVFSEAANAGRKKPFDIRSVMGAVIDQDRHPLERWYGMEDAEIGVVWDAFLGGRPVSVLGFESRPLPRLGFHPADGPDQWTSGTLFPRSSKKVARAINAASGSRPLVILANLSGFDGSPESMRQWQLEYGAEIGRAVVNFKGPIVFCVVSRYHGGAFVVFSNALNDNMQVAALEGSYASVIGGAPAAAVVFAREVTQRARADERVQTLAAEIERAAPSARAKMRHRLDALIDEVRSEKLGEVAAEFDRVHSIERAKEMGSVHEIIPAEELRPWLIGAVAEGMEREVERWEEAGGGEGWEEAPDLQGRKGRKRAKQRRKARRK